MLGHLYTVALFLTSSSVNKLPYEQLGGLACIAIIEIQPYVMKGLKLTPENMMTSFDSILKGVPTLWQLWL